jgi:hypothetical protein
LLVWLGRQLGYGSQLRSCMWAVLRIRDVHPGSQTRISDPGSQIQNSNKRGRWKKIICHTFFVASNFTKLKIILFLKCWRKKFGPIFKVL